MAGKRSRARYEEDLQALQSPYVIYGTPLPPLDANVRDDGSFVPIWKQEVTDERGRKRLHGAFTGGFSAGYFNTVGSKEGWTPATFVSSKLKRWKDTSSKQQTAEDFMDEEDKQEAEEARQVSTKSGFAGLGSTENEVKKRAPMMDLFRPSTDTMGFKLLRKMGWKDGQGIGPRLLRTARRNDGTMTEKPDAEKHLFAPENSKLVLIIRKDNRRGLGYEDDGAIVKPKMQSSTHSDEEDDQTISKLPKASSKKGAFGVGVLNDTGSDDEDPFSLGPKISYSKIIGSKKNKKKPDTKIGSASNPLLGSRPVFVSKKGGKSMAGFRKCHDGRLPLDGFILAISKLSIEPNKYPPPEVPVDWKPSKASTDPSSGTGEWQSTAALAKSSTLEASSRGSILGETPLPGKSVFDFIKPQARDRLVALTKNESLPPARSEAGPATTVNSDPASLIPPLDPAIASSALGRGVRGFIPYTDNPDKLTRYRAYLSYNADLTSDPPTRPANLTQDEWQHEMREFAHAATIFKPMTGSIATRFTTAKNTLQTSTDESTLVTPTTQQDPAAEAASLSMFGHLTRSSTLFYPGRLLCKRFNVPVPTHVHAGNEGTSASKQKSTDWTAEKAPTAAAAVPQMSTFQSSGYQIADERGHVHIAPEAGVADEARDDQGGQTTARGFAAENKSDDAPSGAEFNAALEQERPGDEIFRAIFGSDSEDE